MKLSQAIREGAKIRPQCFGQPFTVDFDHKEVCGSCALGAAYEAVAVMECGGMGEGDYFLMTSSLIPNLVHTYPELDAIMDSTGHTLSDLIWHMNDGVHTATRKHSREEIADQLEKWGY